MNNISDITMLIAVLALALWPAIIVFMTRKAEKKIIYSLKEYGKEENNTKSSTEELVNTTLRKLGCSPEKGENGNIAFMYQGDDFYISLQNEIPFIMIWYPWWGTIDADNPVLPYLKEVINAVNISSFITTVYMSENEGDKEIGIHSHCHTFLTDKVLTPEEHLKMILDGFFETRDTIKESINKLGSQLPEENEEEKKERVIVKGFSSYKDKSTPIEKKEMPNE